MIVLFAEGIDMTMSRIVKWIHYFGYSCIRINDDSKISLKEIFISNGHTSIILNVDEENIQIDNTTVVFARRQRLRLNNTFVSMENPLIKFFLKNEADVIRNFVVQFIDNSTKYCLGSLNNLNLNKLRQLEVASKLGFKIPDSKVLIGDDLKVENQITKPLSDVFSQQYDGCYYKSGGTIDLKKTTDYCGFGFPSLIQEKISKEEEIRVFFFEDNYFALSRRPKRLVLCNITDWRDYNEDYNRMHFYPITLEREVIHKLKLFAREFNINTGSYDLISFNGEYYFLELNIHGQFGFVSGLGNYNIEKQIAWLLIEKQFDLC